MNIVQTPNRYCHAAHNHSGDTHRNEQKTRLVIILTLVMMVFEILGGIMFNSMALLADGWHMATHAGALGIAAFAYYYARKNADDARFTFGTGKVTTLGGYTSAIILGIVALMIAFESIMRIINPISISFFEAILVAFLGLIVNVISAFLLHDHGHGHSHDHDHAHGHHHHHHAPDLNLKAAYLHVIADALTSVLAIIALLCGYFFGLVWLDPAVGVLGAIMIARWSYGLMRETGHVLLDRLPDETLYDQIITALSQDAGNTIEDLHIWAVTPGHYSIILSVRTNSGKTADDYKKSLSAIMAFDHITVEVNRA